MSIACGTGFTFVVTEDGEAWSTGLNNVGQLGLGHVEDVLELQKFKCEWLVCNDPVVMLAAGGQHGAFVTKDGLVKAWGLGTSGQLGGGDERSHANPHAVPMHRFDEAPSFHVVMVACGSTHTIVLTNKHNVYSFGEGTFGKLGYGGLDNMCVPTQVLCSAVHGSPATPLGNILMVSAGGDHNVALGEKGLVWSWGCGKQGQLGHKAMTDRLVAGLVDSTLWENTAGEGGAGAAGGAHNYAVVVAAGHVHSAVVVRSGALYVWGSNEFFQLGVVTSHSTEIRCTPERVVTGWRESADTGLFLEKRVLTVACGHTHTMCVMEDGSLFTWGAFASSPLFSGLGHISNEDARFYGDMKSCPAQVKTQWFDGKVVCAAAGQTHSAVLTDKGTLYTWGTLLGSAHAVAECFPSVVIPDFVYIYCGEYLEQPRLGHFHALSASKALAFAMGTHVRLGGGSDVWVGGKVPYTRMSLRQQGKAPATMSADTDQPCLFFAMPADLVQRVVQTCVAWPAGVAGKTEGIVRLLGGGMLMQ